MDLIWITQAEYLSDYKIQLVFNNGFKGIADLKDSLEGSKTFKKQRIF